MQLYKQHQHQLTNICTLKVPKAASSAAALAGAPCNGRGVRSSGRGHPIWRALAPLQSPTGGEVGLHFILYALISSTAALEAE